MREGEKIDWACAIPTELDQARLDVAVRGVLPDYSRTRIQQWIEAGWVTVAGETRRAKDRVTAGEWLQVNAQLEAVAKDQAQAIELAVIYEDEDLIVVNKPAGLITHPGAGNPDGTMLNALLYRYPTLIQLPRAGIVHRLDKDTTGILVVARNLTAQYRLVEALRRREISREYLAIVRGKVIAGGSIDANIGRHPTKRTQMAVRADGKPAVTHYWVLQRFSAHSYLRVKLETGRTHQIRVHLTHRGFPLVGDPVYGIGMGQPSVDNPQLQELLKDWRRQALHAWRLTLVHPRSGEQLTWEAEPPEDWQLLLQHLAIDQKFVQS